MVKDSGKGPKKPKKAQEERNIDEKLTPEGYGEGKDLRYRDEKHGPNQNDKNAKLPFTPPESNDVIACGPAEELSTNEILVRDMLMEELENSPDFRNDLVKNTPGLKNIKPRPSFRYDEFDPKERHKHVYVFEFDDIDVYLHKDGSLSCYIDRSKSKEEQEQDMVKGVSRMLEVAASLNMRSGMLCLPPDISDRMRERLQEVVKNAREKLGIEVFIGNPSIPMPPRPPKGPPTPSPY